MTCDCAAEIARLLTSINDTMGYTFIALCIIAGLGIGGVFR